MKHLSRQQTWITILLLIVITTCEKTAANPATADYFLSAAMNEEPRGPSTISFRNFLIWVWQCASCGVGRDSTPSKSLNNVDFEKDLRAGRYRKQPRTEQPIAFIGTQKESVPVLSSSSSPFFTNTSIPQGTTTKSTPWPPTTATLFTPTIPLYSKSTVLAWDVEKISTDQLTPPGQTLSSEKKQPISLSTSDYVSSIGSLAPSTAPIKPTPSQLINHAPPPSSDFTAISIQISQTSGILTTVINKELITIETVGSGNGDIVNGVTLSPGSVSTIGDIIISKGLSGLYVLSPSSPAQASMGVIIASVLGINAVVTGSSSEIVIEGKTITPGGTIIASGTTYILPSGKPLAEMSGKTYTIPAATANVAPATINAVPSPGVLINGDILTSGGTIVASGTTYLLPTGGTVPLIETGLPSLTIPISQLSQGSGLILGGQTLLPGGTVVVSGTTYILPTGGTSPVALATASNTFSAVPTRPTRGGAEANGSSVRKANDFFVGLTTMFSAIFTIFFSF